MGRFQYRPTKPASRHLMRLERVLPLCVEVETGAVDGNDDVFGSREFLGDTEGRQRRGVDE